MQRILVALIAFTAMGPGCAHADASECRAKVLLPLEDDLGNFQAAGGTLPIDIERDDPRGASFYAHEGSCIPETLNSTPATPLLNRRIGPSLGNGDHKLVFVLRMRDGP